VSLSHEGQEEKMSDDVSTSDVRPMRLAKRLAIAAALILGVGAAVAPAQAHGRLGAAEGRCKLFIGPDTMNFTGYLPEASKNEFCEDIPSTGPMIMVLDAEQAELRDMKIELRIVKDIGGGDKENENLDAVTVAYKPPLTYPSGTVNFEHNFKEGGYFVGIVTVLGDHGERWVSRFPFSVDRTFMRDLPVYLMLAIGVIAAFAIYLIHRRRNPPPTPLATAAAAFKAPDPSLWADATDEAAAPEGPAPDAGEADKPVTDKGGDDDHDDSDKYRTAAE
jgi:hypothetical protein